jgi:hypothetical protein
LGIFDSFPNVRQLPHGFSTARIVPTFLLKNAARSLASFDGRSGRAPDLPAAAALQKALHAACNR